MIGLGPTAAIPGGQVGGKVPSVLSCSPGGGGAAAGAGIVVGASGFSSAGIDTARIGGAIGGTSAEDDVSPMSREDEASLMTTSTVDIGFFPALGVVESRLAADLAPFAMLDANPPLLPCAAPISLAARARLTERCGPQLMLIASGP